MTFLGLLPVALTEAVAAQLPIDKGTGLLVAHVTPGSPAADAGLQKNDVLARFDDQILANAEQLQTLVRSKKPGAEVKLTYFRKGQQSTTTARLGSKEWKTEDVEALADAGNTLGSAISELEKTLKNKVGPELIESIRRALEDAGKAIDDGAAKK